MVVVLWEFKLNTWFLDLQTNFYHLGCYLKLEFMSIVYSISDSAAEILTLSAVETNGEMTDIRVRNNPSSIIGILFKFLIKYFKSALDSST